MHRMRITQALLAACAVALAPAAWAQSSDSIQSRHVREADGTTGQDTNTGSGIKTGHLQDGAVTAPKIDTGAVGTGAIADGAVTSAKVAPGAVGTAAIADGAVTAPKIAPAAVGTAAIADGAVTAAKVAPGAVGTAAIADGAVTDAKIAGPIPAAKIDRNGLDADSLDGYQAGDFSPIGHDHVLSEIQGIDAFQRRNRNVIVVSRDGTGHFDDLATAVSSITDASASNPYLVKIMPGEYPTGRVEMKRFVDIEGSGQNLTRVVVSDPTGLGFESLMLSPDSEVRDLTVDLNARLSFLIANNAPGELVRLSRVTVRSTACSITPVWTGNGTHTVLEGVSIIVTSPPEVSCSSTAVFTLGRVTMRNSDVRMEGLSGPAVGLSVNGDPYGGDAVVENSTFELGGSPRSTGVSNVVGKLTIRNSSITANFGVVAQSPYSTKLEGSAVVATSGYYAPVAVMAYASGPVSLASSRAEGRVWKDPAATMQCVGVYDASFAPVTCP